MRVRGAEDVIKEKYEQKGLPRRCQRERIHLLRQDTQETGSNPGSGTSPEVENGNLLQCSYLENSMERGAWQPIVHGITNNQTQLGVHAYTGQKGREVRIHKTLTMKASTQALHFHNGEGLSSREVESH